MSAIQLPYVINGAITDWKASQWTPDRLAQMLQQQKVKFRIGLKGNQDVQFETECSYELATVSEFCEWLATKPGTAPKENVANPLLRYEREKYFCYADYNYMVELFHGDESVLKAVDWSVFELAPDKTNDSTLWLCSEGGYSVCHYDTYGWNIVAQLYGRKKWVLFPPEDTACMYPTRVPYEESSVFSQVNVVRPDVQLHPKFKNVTPYVVTLNPGEVLYVPRHWWHYVESVGPSISVNTWVEMAEDTTERLREAVTRTVLYSMMRGTTDNWLNPTEDPSSDSDDILLLNFSLRDQYTDKTTGLLKVPGESSAHASAKAHQHPKSALKDDTQTKMDTKSVPDKQLGATADDKERPSPSNAHSKSAQFEEEIDQNEEIPAPKRFKSASDLSALFPSDRYQFVSKLIFAEYIHKWCMVNDKSQATSSRLEAPVGMGHRRSRRASAYDGMSLITMPDFASCVVDAEVLTLICDKLQRKYGDKLKSEFG